MLALNVRTLAPKLEALLALPFDVMCFSEVRASYNAKKAMTRMSAALGFTCVWSSSPPPSPTFSVSPGGTALFVRDPLTCSEIRPPALERWNSQARLCVANVCGLGNLCVTIASCYGYPVSHEDRGLNEAYLRDVLSYLGRLTNPAVMIGDLNDHPSTSQALAGAHVMNMFRLTDDSPTTLSKQGHTSGRLPLDHCLANTSAASLPIRAKVDSTLVLSDHLPILLDAPRSLPDFLCIRWSRPPRVLKPKTVHVEWIPTPCDYSCWQEAARQWLEHSHQQWIEPKECYWYERYAPSPPARHVTFRRLLTLQKAVVELHEHYKTASQEKSIVRKLRALGLTRLEPLLHRPAELRGKVQEMVQAYMHKHHRAALKKWKKTAKSWKLSDAPVFAFLRNRTPVKVVGIAQPEEGPVTHPWQVQLSLMNYWSSLENWTQQEQEGALEILEDRYSMFLPNQPCDLHLHARSLADFAKRATKSTPGLDAWTHAELAFLPLPAWQQLQEICAQNPLSLLMSVTSMYRRVPIPKGQGGVCLPSEIRPIDVFSVILRVMASATTGILRTWIATVLHPGQFASKGGVVIACAKIEWITELSLVGVREFWGVSVDFAKMFNMLSAAVAVRTAIYMGLSPDYAALLVFPILGATGLWSLPHGAASVPYSNTRGLLQGMSTSVLLSELAISPSCGELLE